MIMFSSKALHLSAFKVYLCTVSLAPGVLGHQATVCLSLPGNVSSGIHA
jgi:hypothetical protein